MEEKISTKPDGRLSGCKLPSGNPLKSHSGEHDEVPIEEIDRKIRNIRAVLSEHKVKVADIQAVSGPSVTTYKVYPAPGVSCAKIKRLQNEIEFFLDAGGVRVVTLSAAVGIEVANEHPSVVPLKSLLEDAAFRESKAALPVAVGRDTEGKPCVVDLAKAPHILMAGETKQGKTTAVHSLILSLLYSRTPEDVKFVFIDPKGCELKVYRLRWIVIWHTAMMALSSSPTDAPRSPNSRRASAGISSGCCMTTVPTGKAHALFRSIADGWPPCREAGTPFSRRPDDRNVRLNRFKINQFTHC